MKDLDRLMRSDDSTESPFVASGNMEIVTEESSTLLRALAKNTAAITLFASNVAELTETLRELLAEEHKADEEDDRLTYLNGDSIER